MSSVVVTVRYSESRYSKKELMHYGIICVGDKSTFWGGDILRILPENMCMKNNKMPKFYIFARKILEFYMIVARKIFFPEFL